jgi:hypothetical protein
MELDIALNLNSYNFIKPTDERPWAISTHGFFVGGLRFKA